MTGRLIDPSSSSSFFLCGEGEGLSGGGNRRYFVRDENEGSAPPPKPAAQGFIDFLCATLYCHLLGLANPNIGGSLRIGSFNSSIMLLIAMAMSMPLAAQSADDAIVSRFYPDRLVAGIDSEDLVRSFRYVRADLDGSGQSNYIVAVYCNGTNDVLRVLKVQNGVAALADEPDMPNMGGGRGSVRTVDVDGDGKPEVLLSIAGERQSEDWLLKWNGSKLSILSPVRTDSRGKPHSLLSSVQLIDIDGDGLPELLVRYAPLHELPITRVYKLVNGAYIAAPDVYLHDRFVRTKGEPNEFDYTFSVSAPGNYILHVVNGDTRGNGRVNAGEIDINDQVLVNEQRFKEQLRTLDIPVTLAALNEMYVVLRSAPGSEITISLSKAN